MALQHKTCGSVVAAKITTGGIPAPARVRCWPLRPVQHGKGWLRRAVDGVFAAFFNRFYRRDQVPNEESIWHDVAMATTWLFWLAYENSLPVTRNNC